MTDKFQNLPENESFERVAKVAEERAAFNEQMALREALERIEALQEALAQQVEACFCLDCEMCFRHEQLLKGTGQ